MLASGAPLFTLVDDSRLEFRASVPSADWSKVKVGDAADVTVDALPGLRIEGKVARVTPLVEERTRSFVVVVRVAGREELVGGLFARATVRVGRVPGALVVPPAALLRDGGSPSEARAFVVNRGVAEERTVKLGVEAPAAVQVTQGLAPGEVVIVDPPTGLASASRVEVVNRTR
jgi:RND family efflux transporter MFP subunit